MMQYKHLSTVPPEKVAGWSQLEGFTQIMAQAYIREQLIQKH